MQLKRDTDYAIRILYCLKEGGDRIDPVPGGLTLGEISAQTGVPKITAGRICDNLDQKGLLSPGERGGDEKGFLLPQRLLQKSLLDVVEAMESTGQILAVFDKQSVMYKKCEEQLLKAQEEIRCILAGISLEGLMQTKK